MILRGCVLQNVCGCKRSRVNCNKGCIFNIVATLLMLISSTACSEGAQKQTWETWVNKKWYNKPVVNLLVTPEDKVVEELQATIEQLIQKKESIDQIRETLSLALDKQKARNNTHWYHLKRKTVVAGVAVLVIVGIIYFCSQKDWHDWIKIEHFDHQDKKTVYKIRSTPINHYSQNNDVTDDVD